MVPGGRNTAEVNVGSVLLFGDSWGLRQLIQVLPPGLVCGLVVAENRPQYHAEVRVLADTRQLPLLIQPRVSSETYVKFVMQVQSLAPDLTLACSHAMLIHPEILDIPRLGAINIHGGLLPQYRGCNPIQWALLNHETETGVTMHYMTAEFDAGDMIAQRRVPIYFEDTWCDIQTRLDGATQTLLREEVPKLLNHTSTSMPQDERSARYYRRRKPEDGLITWQESVLAIYDLVRALVRPHPGAFYYCGSEKIVLDTYLWIPEIVVLKYGPAGGQQLQSASLQLYPLLDGTRPSNDMVLFAIRSVRTNQLLGTCELRSVNYRDRSGELSIRLEEDSPQDAPLLLETAGLLRQFAVADLGLRRLASTCRRTGPSTSCCISSPGLLVRRTSGRPSIR